GTVDGKNVMVGKLSYVAPDANVNKAKTTAVYVSVDGKYAGCITFKDRLRPETPQTLARLRKQGAKHIMMLT
ncbi:heavy metal translocating P-type ATPase, partial [Streptococcus thermophilus]|nr:heavy metal translocating P-type ATPase [Streptococcus thermophilus]